MVGHLPKLADLGEDIGAKVLPTWEEAIPGIRKALFGKRLNSPEPRKK